MTYINITKNSIVEVALLLQNVYNLNIEFVIWFIVLSMSYLLWVHNTWRSVLDAASDEHSLNAKIKDIRVINKRSSYVRRKHDHLQLREVGWIVIIIWAIMCCYPDFISNNITFNTLKCDRHERMNVCPLLIDHN